MTTAPTSAPLAYGQPGIRFEEDGHRYFVTLDGRGEERWPSATQALEVAGLTDDYAGVPAPVLYRAGARGTAIHKAIPLLLDGTLDWSTVDDRIVGHVEQLALALDELKVEAWNCEAPVYSRRLRLAGTPDIWGPARCRPTVVDAKSGKKTPLAVDAARLQTSLYGLMIREALREAGLEPPPHIERIALWLTPTGYEPQRFGRAMQDELDAEAAVRVAWRRAAQRTKGVWTP
ncbi:MAG: PD-(D/E)XK nuclease family protein [Planctomycetota bacterium]|jgi:hypothetical protein